MSQKPKAQVPAAGINEDYLKYIIVPPDYLKLFVPGTNDHIVYMQSLREEGIQYFDGPEEKFKSREPETHGKAFVYYQEVYQVFFIHVPSTGRFYLTSDIIEVGEILKHLRATEGTKIVK